jgi:hypothetical protein
LDDIIQFTVEMGPVKVEMPERRGKDVVAHWKMYDGFDATNKFWTDSNELGMIERQLYHRDSFKQNPKASNISSNYYPVDSAIAIRDNNQTNLQVTIMNDRA